MSYVNRGNKRARNEASSIEHAVVLSGDAAHVNYEDTTPVWKQEVTDERGRKRLHGAFTGGFSAGYFNTVGSAEGWTPSTFVSSRTHRYKAAENKVTSYMDEEDLAEIEADRQLQIKKAEEAKDVGHAQVPEAKSVKEETSIATKPKLVPRLAAPIGGAKALSLMDDDEDMDAFDIGPQIKYDKDLTKRKKMTQSKHTFQSRKTVRNPKPEAEIVRLGSDSPKAVEDKPVDAALLPSIGTSSSVKETALDLDRKSPWQAEAKVPPWRQVHEEYQPEPLGQAVAQAALQSTFSPYPTDPKKHSRYRRYLETEAGNISTRDLGVCQHERHLDIDEDAWKAELAEFRKAGLMYQPLSGPMSDKFTSSVLSSEPVNLPEESLQVRAAKGGKYGHLTRVVQDWTPNRLLLKRFNLQVHANETKSEPVRGPSDRQETMNQHKKDLDDLMNRAIRNAKKFK